MNAQANPPPFSNQVQGQEAQAIDLTLGRIAADVYAPDPGSSVDSWTPLSDDELRRSGIRPSLLVDENTGFKARIYVDSQSHYALAFRGSDEGKDWLHNLRQGVGLDDAQYRQAIELAKRARLAYGDNLVITGHSLGGGLAATASMATDVPAVTFNAAGVHDRTMERLKLDPAQERNLAESGLIRRYSVDNEILTELQENKIPTRWVMPDAVGHKIQLPDPDPQSFWQRLVPGSSLKHGVEFHGMNAVLKAQQLAQPSLTNPEHPGHAMFDQALRGLHDIDANTLGFRAEPEYQNAAGALAVRARSGGLNQIDHVVLGANGSKLFAVEGGLDDASHRMVHLDKAQAASQPIEHSSAQASERQAEQQSQIEREPRRTMVTP